ncbi:hypothetical protein [Vibrio profundi]|uniref:hypothetical protein n=1 Tax=Vibrio profundi TaxID=1774960 RepID=UPI00373547CD
MKKVIIGLVLLLLIGGGGAAYYFLVMNKEQAEPVEQDVPTQDTNAMKDTVDSKPIMDLSQQMGKKIYYVKERRVAIVNDPSDAGVIEGYRYKSDEVEILEKKDGWVRISDYIVYEDGGEEVAEWIAMDGLSKDEVIISDEENLEILDSYIEESDDLLSYKDQFRKATKELISKGDCSPEDFDELGGWVKSIKFENKEIYFIYCDGMKLENKIYLDVIKNETFRLE